MSHRPLGSVAPAVGPLVLLFRMLVVSVLCRNFVGCVSPTLCFCACRNTQDKIWHKKELCRLESGEFKLYYIEIKRALITSCKDKLENLNMKSKCALSLGGSAHLSDVLALLQA